MSFSIKGTLLCFRFLPVCSVRDITTDNYIDASDTIREKKKEHKTSLSL